MTSSSKRILLWAGPFVGALAWLVVIGIGAATTGELHSLLPLISIGFGATFLLWLQCIAAMELSRILRPLGHPSEFHLVMASVWTFVALGVVILTFLFQRMLQQSAPLAAWVQKQPSGLWQMQTASTLTIIGFLLTAIVWWLVALRGLTRKANEESNTEAKALQTA